MKSVQCDLCETKIQGENFDAWFQSALSHWKANHADVMKAMANKSKEDGEKWMAEAKRKFEEA
ncbi:hypothetical protein COB57_01855 [Candidatus Peregrinibacteria bacterium]|nr:MAG: hypothetical protein COB57_01855 [Candidatus Peregrinibacteria bacterium]